MSCQRVAQLLAESVAAADRDGVRKHLESCEECRSLLTQLEELEALRVALARRQRAPQDFSSRVFRAVEETRRTAHRKLMATVGAAALGLVMTAGYYSTGSEVPGRIAPSSLPESETSGYPDRPMPISGFPFAGDQPLSLEVPFVEVELIDPMGKIRIVRLPARIEIRQRDLGRDSTRPVSY